MVHVRVGLRRNQERGEDLGTCVIGAKVTVRLANDYPFCLLEHFCSSIL